MTSIVWQCELAEAEEEAAELYSYAVYSFLNSSHKLEDVYQFQ